MGTWNPTMPNNFCDAKKIWWLIIEKSDEFNGSEDEHFALDDGIEDFNEEGESVNKVVEDGDGAAN